MFAIRSSRYIVSGLLYLLAKGRRNATAIVAASTMANEIVIPSAPYSYKLS